MTHRNKILGFLSSLALHGGLAGILLWQQPFQSTEVYAALPLKLEMFEMVQHTQPETVPEKAEEPIEAAPVPQQITETVKPKQIVKKKAVVTKQKNLVPKKLPVQEKPLVTASRSNTMPPARSEIIEAAISPVTDSGEKDRIKERYIRQLMNTIAVYKYYPQRARRRHLQGRVEVSFVILADGTIENIRLADSSGSGILDKAALGVLRRAGRFEALPEELGLSSWAFVVPMDYRLL